MTAGDDRGSHVCRAIEVDGVAHRVRVAPDISEPSLEAVRALIRAAIARHALRPERGGAET